MEARGDPQCVGKNAALARWLRGGTWRADSTLLGSTRSFQRVERLRIRTRRLRCCGSGDFMHLSRRFLIVFLAFLASASVLRSAAAAQAYLIADAQTGYILEEQEPRKKLQVGSLTKIATASVVLDWAERKSGDLNQSGHHPAGGVCRHHGKQHRLSAGRHHHVARSSLCCARAIGQYRGLYAGVSRRLAAGSQLDRRGRSKLTPADMFVAQMNALAKQLKMERTRFVNPHGID